MPVRKAITVGAPQQRTDRRRRPRPRLGRRDPALREGATGQYSYRNGPSVRLLVRNRTTTARTVAGPTKTSSGPESERRCGTGPGCAPGSPSDLCDTRDDPCQGGQSPSHPLPGWGTCRQASNCVFVRSKGVEDLPDRRRREEACWSFHQAVISELGVRLIVCLGKDALSAVSRQMGTGRQIDEHVEANERAWASQVFKTEGGMITVGLTHPSRTAWNYPASDPSPVVIRALEMLHQVHDDHGN